MTTETDLHPTIDPSGCTVEQICGPGSHGVAIWVYDKGQCWVLCQSSVAAKERPTLSLETRVSIQIVNVERAWLGGVFASLCDTELFIPAAAASGTVTLSINDTTFADAIAQAGLVTGEPGPLK